MEIDFALSAADLVIAGFALLIVGLQTYFARQHNRLSVEPYLTVRRWANDEDGCFFERHLILENKGLGSAIIEKTEFFINGAKREEVSSFAEVVKYIRENYPEKPVSEKMKDWSSYDFSENAALMAGESVTLARIKLGFEVGLEKIEEVERFSEKIDFKTTYKSMYGGKKYELSTLE